VIRFEIRSWIGSGSAAERDEAWKCWGRWRAHKTAHEIIARYRERGLPDWEVMIFGMGRGAPPQWFFSAERERDGLPPLNASDLRLAR